MRIIQTANYEQLSQTAAILILSEVLSHPRFVLGLATGQTPAGLYQALVESAQALGLKPDSLISFHLDEYVGLELNHPESMAAYLKTHFLDPLAIPATQQFFVPAASATPQQACLDYEAQIAAAGGIDLQILGIGRNGHIAFNEPGTAFHEPTHLVSLSQDTRQANAKHFASGETPLSAMTMGPASILKARQIILLASGKSKAEAVKQMLSGPLDESCPASILRLHPDVTLVLDQAAASALEPPFKSFCSEPLATFPIGVDLPESCQRIVVAAPHPDDASIGCGGTLARLHKQGAQIHLVSMSAGHRAEIPGTSQAERVAIREAEGRQEALRLQADFTALNLPFYERGYMPGSEDIQRLFDLLIDVRPTAIFSSSVHDRHPAHRASALIVQEAAKRYQQETQQILEIWFYEGPWYLFERDNFNTVVQLRPDEITLKMLGVQSHDSQVSRKRYDLAAEALARFRAITVPESRLSGFGETLNLDDHVEIFERVRWRVPTRKTGI